MALRPPIPALSAFAADHRSCRCRGRPRRILLCVLVDRGDRELPIQPDITGRWVQVMENQRVDVLVPELDGDLCVELIQIEADAS